MHETNQERLEVLWITETNGFRAKNLLLSAIHYFKLFSKNPTAQKKKKNTLLAFII